MKLIRFLCVYENGETYCAWTETRDRAAREATAKSGYGKPWRVLKTSGRMEVPA